jgi:hypothetical protein
VIRIPVRLMLCILFLIAFLAACTKSPQVTDVVATPTPIDMIQPGDTINGVLVTTGGVDSTFVFDLPCKEKDGIYVCILTLGKTYNITASVYGSTPEELQSNWETFVYSYSINGQPVDLPAFGTIDFVHERTGL